MKFSAEFKDQLRERVVLSDVVRRKVRLTQKTKGNYLGLCPFHNEKSPSFTVNDAKAMYHCFGCKASGDAIKFIMETEGASFVDTLTSLATMAGMTLPKPEKNDALREQKATSLYEVMKLACDWYQRQLTLRHGKEALQYLENRGVTADTIEKFSLGYAPEKRGSLTDALKEHGVTEKLLLDAGLLGKSERGEIYERFRNRIIFPILDTRQRVIAFGGRIMGAGQPKYLNSPETALFKKSDVLYAEHLAQKTAHDSGSVIVAEGYMDVIALHMAGFTSAVGPLGTAVTDTHILRLWRLAKEPVMCLDGDSAGMKAMKRVAEHSLPLLKPGYSLRFALLPQGSDPDELLKLQGKAALQRVLNAALPLSEMIWRIENADKPAATPDEKASLEERLMKLAETIADKTIRSYYQKYFRNKLWELDKSEYQTQKKGKKDARSPAELLPVAPEITALQSFDTRAQWQQMLLALVIKYPDLLENEQVADEFLRIEFTRPSMHHVRAAVLEILGQPPSENNQELHKDLKITLEKNGYAHDIENLCGETSLFSAYFSSGLMKDTKSLWYYFLNQYNLTLMRSEWHTALNEMTESSMARATAYQAQINELEKQVGVLYSLLQNDDGE